MKAECGSCWFFNAEQGSAEGVCDLLLGEVHRLPDAVMKSKAAPCRHYRQWEEEDDLCVK
jgi:hypothetical protein